MDKPQIIAHIQKSLNFTLFDTAWIPVSAKFVVVGSTPRDTGCVQIYDVTKNDVVLLREVSFLEETLHCFQSEKGKSFKCCTFGASLLPKRQLATGAFDGRMAIWDLGQDGRLDTPVYGVQAHDEIVNAIDAVGGLGVGEGQPEIATGSRDGCVRVWDPRQPKTPVASMEPETNGSGQEGDTNAPQSKRDCWAVAFGNAYNSHDRCLAAGYDNGDLKLFDLRAMKVRWETNLKNGVCGIQFDRKDIEMNKLVATTLESKFHVFDMRTQHPKRGFASLVEKAHSSTIWQVKHLPQQRDIFMTTGGNGSLNLWKYNYPKSRKRSTKEEENGRTVEHDEGVMGSVSLLQNMVLSNQPISSMDWCAEKMGLAVCVSFDQVLRLLIVTKLNRI